MAPKFKLEVTYHRCQEKELLLLPFNPEVFLKSKTENGKQKTENRKQKTENRKPKTENRKQKTQQTPNNKHQTINILHYPQSMNGEKLVFLGRHYKSK
jgi:hypothetical protein